MTLDVLPKGTARPQYDDELPEWVQELRPQQVDAVQEAVEAFAEAPVVIIDAPVGSGKTLIGELVPRELDRRRRLYLCSDRALQEQVLRDFPYANVLKGRGNYPTLTGGPEISAEDCTSERPGQPCRWCDSVQDCPYRVAKAAALASRMPVLNTSYYLHVTNYTDTFTPEPFVVADECDLLEDALMGFIEYEVPIWINRLIREDMPKKGVHKPTLVQWMSDFEATMRAWFADRGATLEPKRQRAFKAFGMETRTVAAMLQRDIDHSRKTSGMDPDEETGQWIRDYDTHTLKMRPVTVAPYGLKRLWQHSKQWLLMSGTVVSAAELADSLGLPFDYRVVTVPSTFPVENRPIIMAPVADVTYKRGERDWSKLVRAIEAICERHPGRVLVHTVSYRLAHYLYDHCDLGGRHKFTHSDGREKQKALAAYLGSSDSVIFSPSMQRGVDLAEDRCRVQIICKTPFPSLGDKQVSARVHMPGGSGQLWYAVKTVREIVQMTGRGVRSDTDQCITYILDQQFARNIWGKYSNFFLPSFREAVNTRSDIRWLM